MLLYAAAWRVLVAADDPRAEALRAAARLELRERSARIPDPDARRTYLDVTVHRLLLND
jgi:hypothetical protein